MPSAAILPPSLAIPQPFNRSLSSSIVLTGPNHFRPVPSLAGVGLLSPATIRMGGGPRTYPGGVSKWQWKRMQDKKAKQLLKARLSRERQLYEMRKRAELKAAISELERPWEVVERAPVLFSVSADEQVKVLADRFQRPGGFDMWSERDGPQIFRSADDLPSARFFPKGAVHSAKPYGVIARDASDVGDDSNEVEMRYDDWIARGAGGIGRGRRAKRLLPHSRLLESDGLDSGEGGVGDCSLDFEHVVASSSEEGDEITGDLSQRGGVSRGRGENHDSHVSELVGAGEGEEMAGNFSSRSRFDSYGERLKRRGGGGRGRLDQIQHRGGSHVRHNGRGGNRGSYGLDAELAVAGSREEGDEMTGSGFNYRHGRSLLQRDRSLDWRSESFDRRGSGGGGGGGGGGRGGGRIQGVRSLVQRDRSLDWRSESFDRRGSGGGGGRGGGRIQGVRRTGSVSLRPTTELNLLKGGRGRSDQKWREGRNDGFSVHRRARSP